MDRKPQRSTLSQSGQEQPKTPAKLPEQTLRIPVVRGLSAGERQNPSPLVASVIAQQEQAVRRNTSGLEPSYTPQPEQQKSAQRSSQKPLIALLSWLQGKRFALRDATSHCSLTVQSLPDCRALVTRQRRCR